MLSPPRLGALSFAVLRFAVLLRLGVYYCMFFMHLVAAHRENRVTSKPRGHPSLGPFKHRTPSTPHVLPQHLYPIPLNRVEDLRVGAGSDNPA
ncbi:hypothetical protein B0H16DRAFT_1555853, partial [Mycena metata]